MSDYFGNIVEDTSCIRDGYTRACADALYYLSYKTECPNTRMFSKLFLWDLIANDLRFEDLLKSPCGNMLVMIQCALEFVQDKTHNQLYVLEEINKVTDN